MHDNLIATLKNLKGRGRGLVASVLTFFSKDPSSNPAEVGTD